MKVSNRKVCFVVKHAAGFSSTKKVSDELSIIVARKDIFYKLDLVYHRYNNVLFTYVKYSIFIHVITYSVSQMYFSVDENRYQIDEVGYIIFGKIHIPFLVHN